MLRNSFTLGFPYLKASLPLWSSSSPFVSPKQQQQITASNHVSSMEMPIILEHTPLTNIKYTSLLQENAADHHCSMQHPRRKPRLDTSPLLLPPGVKNQSFPAPLFLPGATAQKSLSSTLLITGCSAVLFSNPLHLHFVQPFSKALQICFTVYHPAQARWRIFKLSTQKKRWGMKPLKTRGAASENSPLGKWSPRKMASRNFLMS